MLNRKMSLSKSSKWGSVWTEDKLAAFTKYVSAYLTIMGNNKEKYGWKTLYFDGFAGSGDLEKNGGVVAIEAVNPLLLDLDIEEAETQIYRGAAERILMLQKKFDYYYFIDLNGESLNRLKEKLNPIGINYRLQFREGDANKYIKELAAALKKDKTLKALILLDPFGMQIHWESLELLRETASDVWVLVPSGVIINRLLCRNGDIKQAYLNKLCRFFGLTKKEILDEFMRKELIIHYSVMKLSCKKYNVL